MYLGRSPTIGTQRLLDSIESQFNGALTTFDLRYGGVPTYPTLSAGLLVSIGGVLQEPSEAYYVSSDKIVLSEAPVAGTECWILLYSEFGAAQSGAGEAAIAATGEPMGFENRPHSTISFASNTRTFSIAPNTAAGHSSYAVWTKGTRRTYSVAQSVQIGTTTGLYYIYFDGGGALQSKTTYFTWDTETPVAYVYWNGATGSAPFVADERHGIVLDWATHEYLHRTRGAVIAEGFSISAYTTTGNGNADAHAQFDLGNGTFFDEDLEVAITHSASPTVGTFTQVLTGAAELPVFYLSGSSGAWVRDTPTEYACKQSATTLQYNLLTGSTWSTTPATNNRYVVSWVVATNDITAPIIAILGQEQYTAIGSAEATRFGDLVLTNFPIVEFRPLWKVIFQTSTSFTNAPNALVANVLDLRQLSETGEGGTVVSDHGLMSGLADDDHTQYLHASLDRAGVGANISTTGNLGGANLTLTGQLKGPANFIIDPAVVGDDTGTVEIKGNLTVQGLTTTINSTTLTVDDKNIVLGDTASPTDALADGGGITLKGSTDKTIAWLDGTDAWTLSEHVSIASAKEYRIAGTKVLDATGLGSAVVGSSLTSVGTIGTGTWQGGVIAGAYGGTGVANTGKTITLGGDLTTSGNFALTLTTTAATSVTLPTTGTLIASGAIINADVNASAAIADTKLDTIATAGKVSNSATTATSALGINTIVARDGSNNFTAGTITAALTGAASSNVLKAGDTMTGALVMPLGAFGTPSLTFTGDLNTGIFSPGENQLAISANGAEVARFDSSSNLLVTGGFLPTNTSRLVVRGFSSGTYNNTFSQTNATAQIISNEMSAAGWHPTFNIAMVRQSLTTGGNAFGGIGFSTIDDSNSSGMFDAGRIAIVNENGSAVASGTAMAFYTQVGSATNTDNATERLRITSTGTLNLVGAGTAGSTQAVSLSGTAPVNSLVLDSSGRVGLGISSPSALLHCFSPDSINTTAYFRLTNSSVGSGLYRNLHIDGTHPNGASSWKGIDITPAQATIAPMTGIDMSWSQIYAEGRGVNINLSKNTHAGGGAGIGVFSRVIATGTNDLSYEAIGGWFVTDKGAGALDPYTSYTLKVENRSTVNNTNLTAFYTDSSTIRGSIYYDRTNNALALSGSNAFRIDTNGSPRLFVNSSGDVGIGNVIPTYKLTIDKQGTSDWGAGLKRILSVDNNWVYSTFRTPYTVTTTTHPAGWYNIVKILSWDFNVGIHITFSGDFTADQIDIEAKSSWNAGLNNSNAGPHLRVNRTMAHNGNRLQQVRIGYDSIGNTYIQAYLNLTFGAAGAVKVAVVDKCSAWADTVVKAEPMLTTATSITVLNTVNLANTAGEYYNLNGVAGDFVWGTNATERLRITSTGTLNLVGAGTAGSTQAVSFSGTAPVNSLVLDSSGRVGLGIISPTAKLQVAGSLSAYNSTSTEGAMAEAFSEIISQPINLGPGESLDVGTIPITNNNNWRAIVRGTYSNNYEGGGLTPPSFYLELNSTQNTIPCGGTSITVSRNTSTNRLKFLNNNDTSRVTFTGTIEIIVNNQSSQPVNSITTIGRVGVGTISPAELLHVAGTIRMNAVPGTNTNAALPVLFQTSEGNIDGGSSLTYNPGGDELSVNGNSISVSTFRGGGNLGLLTCANGSGQYDFRATNDSLRFIAGSSEAGRFDSGRNLLVGNSSTNIGTGFADKTNRCFIGGATGAGGGIGAYGFISSLSGTATFVVANNGALRVTIYSTANSESARIGQYIFVGLNKNAGSDPVVQSTLTNSPNWTFSYTHAGGTNTLVTVTAPASETYFQGIRIIVEPLG